MKKAWKIVLIAVLTVIVLGAICTGVGVLTGANVNVIYSVLDERYHVAMYWDYAKQVVAALVTQL